MGGTPQVMQQRQGTGNSGPYYSNQPAQDPYRSTYLMDPNNPNYSGMPATPGFRDIYNAETMSLLPGYQQYMDANSAGYDKYSKEATRSAGVSSPWATLAKDYQNTLSADARERGIGEVEGATAKALSGLAAQGGLSSGARERATETGAKNYADMSQGVTRQNTLNNMQVDINDEQNRIKMLSELPGMEMNRANAWQQVRAGDQANMIGNNKALNDYMMGIYGKQMDAWGADKQATATENSGKK